MSQRSHTVVFDTNVVVSALLTPNGVCDQLFQHANSREISFVISPQLFDEYRRILQSKGIATVHKLEAGDLERLLEGLRNEANFVELTGIPSVIADDPTDNVIIATALAGHAGFIVSGDKHLLELKTFQGIEILNPRSMLMIIESGS